MFVYDYVIGLLYCYVCMTMSFGQVYVLCVYDYVIELIFLCFGLLHVIWI